MLFLHLGFKALARSASSSSSSWTWFCTKLVSALLTKIVLCSGDWDWHELYFERRFKLGMLCVYISRDVEGFAGIVNSKLSMCCSCSSELWRLFVVVHLKICACENECMLCNCSDFGNFFLKMWQLLVHFFTKILCISCTGFFLLPSGENLPRKKNPAGLLVLAFVKFYLPSVCFSILNVCEWFIGERPLSYHLFFGYTMCTWTFTYEIDR